MAAQAWYDYGIESGAGSHAGGDDGDDVPTPDNTPISMPFPGHVIDASYHDYGGQVVVDVDGTGYSEYAIHLNNILVQPGQQIPAGTVIGTSGGGVGDNVLHNGRVQPAQSQSWFDGHSGGYHTEYGIFEGEDMGAFNQGWGNHSRQLDPTGVLQELADGKTPSWPGNGPGPTGAPGSPQAVPLVGGLTNPLSPQTWVQGIAQGLGFSSPGNAMQRLTVGAVGVGAVVLAVVMVLQPEAAAARDAVEDHFVKRAKKVIELVGAAA